MYNSEQLERSRQDTANEIGNLLGHKDTLLRGRTFSQLTFEEQLRYSGILKQLAVSYWNYTMTSCMMGQYLIAIKSFYDAYQINPYYGIVLKKLLVASGPQFKTQELKPTENVNNNFYLGLCYRYGLGIPQDHIKASEFFTAAVAGDHLQAKTEQAFLYADSDQLERDPEKAFELYRLAAEGGDPAAQSEFAALCDERIDEAEALRWHQLSAGTGYGAGLVNLGCFYFSSDLGSPQDRLRAFRLAAEQGSPEGQYWMGHCLYEGMAGLRKNKERAMHWYKLAAEQNYPNVIEHLIQINSPPAQYILAHIKNDLNQVLTLLDSYPDLQITFFKEDLTKYLQNKEALIKITNFLSKIENEAIPHHQNLSAILIDVLLFLDHQISKTITPSDEMHDFAYALLNTADLANTGPASIKNLMHFILELAENAEEQNHLLQPLLTLWYRAKTLGVPMDDLGLNKLFAKFWIKNRVEGNYSVALHASVTEKHLSTLIFCREVEINPLTFDVIKNICVQLTNSPIQPLSWLADSNTASSYSDNGNDTIIVESYDQTKEHQYR